MASGDEDQLRRIVEIYTRSRGKWIGCDWSTSFGSRQLNLNGLTSEQAQLVARATAGEEAREWRAAGHWLVQVEQDAFRAENEAGVAMLMFKSGNLDRALGHAARACSLEANYHQNPIWERFRRALAAVRPVVQNHSGFESLSQV
jgi:hypothetical protein